MYGEAGVINNGMIADISGTVKMVTVAVGHQQGLKNGKQATALQVEGTRIFPKPESCMSQNALDM